MSWDIKTFQFVGNILSYKEIDFILAAALAFLQKEIERGRVFPGHKEKAFPVKTMKVHVHILYYVIQTAAQG